MCSWNIHVSVSKLTGKSAAFNKAAGQDNITKQITLQLVLSYLSVQLFAAMLCIHWIVWEVEGGGIHSQLPPLPSPFLVPQPLEMV